MVLKAKKLTQQIELANQFLQNSEYAKAKKTCLKVMKTTPNSVQIIHCLGLVYFKENDFSAAITLFKKALKIKNNVSLQQSLASAYYKNGDFDKAERTLQRLLNSNHDVAEAHQLLGELYYHQGDLDIAELSFLTAITIEPNFGIAYYWLGLILLKQGYIPASISAFQHLLKFKINDEVSAKTYHSLAAAYMAQGQIVEALDCLSKALQKKPDSHQIHSAYLSTLNYLYGFEGEKVFAEYLQFNLMHTLMLDDIRQNHSNKVVPDRKLKIAYVSPDFRDHALFNFIEPIFRNYSSEEFSIYCYFSYSGTDQYTEKLKQLVTKWIDCTRLSDSELATQIIDDKVDILVDLAGHTVGNRLMTFARKPAPIQITLGGYPYTTGLTNMDYRVTDPYLDPVGMTEKINSEQLLYLPTTAFFCPPEIICEVNQLPALESDYFTLASFNQAYKINDDVIKLWSEILKKIPNSRLYMLIGDAENEVIQEQYREKFVSLGVNPNQIIFFARQTIDKYMQFHHKIDLCLDTFPFNGGTTTHYSLWMGVPVITIAGNTPCSRIGVTILSAMQLPQCIANNAVEYIELCVDFSKNLPTLAQLRLTLRETMKNSAIRDEQSFVSSLDAAYREVWQQWCNAQAELT